MGLNWTKKKRLIVLLSPFFIICMVHFVAIWGLKTIPEWCWLITALTYWALTGLCKAIFVDKKTLTEWFQKPVHNPKWLAIALALGIFPALGILLPNFSLLFEYTTLTLFLILFALINPWFEEGYWRGLLLDAGSHFPRWLIVLYSTILFVLSHPLMWGVFSIANRSVQMYVVLFVMGIVWSFIRYKTNSLRWSVYSHMLVDVGNLSIFVFLNLYIPPGMA